MRETNIIDFGKYRAKKRVFNFVDSFRYIQLINPYLISLQFFILLGILFASPEANYLSKSLIISVVAVPLLIHLFFKFKILHIEKRTPSKFGEDIYFSLVMLVSVVLSIVYIYFHISPVISVIAAVHLFLHAILLIGNTSINIVSFIKK